MPTIMITGANRGIGLALSRSFVVDGWRVHACCRHPERAKDLKLVDGNVKIHKLDVTDELRVSALARELAEEPIDILINNAGYYGPKKPVGQLDYDDWTLHFKVNAMGPMRMVEAFIPHLERGDRKIILNLSSKAGSVSCNDSGNSYPYRSSKAALNMVNKSLSIDLAERKMTVVALHPGWVQTEMGGQEAPITTAKSVSDLRKVIAGLSLKDSGSFLAFDGSYIPW